MSLAQITYNAGRSYKVEDTVFIKGKPIQTSDAKLIQYCSSRAGFTVTMKKQPERVVREVVGE